MALENTLISHDYVDVSLAAGESATVEVPSGRADTIVTLIDDGAGGAPATYDMVQRAATVAGRRMQYDSVAGETARSWVDQAVGETFEVELTNTSAGAADYTIVVEARV